MADEKNVSVTCKIRKWWKRQIHRKRCLEEYYFVPEPSASVLKSERFPLKIALLVEEGNFIRQTDLSFPLEPADPWPWCGVGTQVLLHARAQKKPGFWGLRYWQLWMDRAGVSASTSGEKVVELTVSVCQVSKKGGSRAESSACVSQFLLLRANPWTRSSSGLPMLSLHQIQWEGSRERGWFCMYETLRRLSLGWWRVGKETFNWWLDLSCVPVNAFKKGPWWAEASIVVPREVAGGIVTAKTALCSGTLQHVAVEMMYLSAAIPLTEKTSQISCLEGSLFQHCSADEMVCRVY